MVPLTKTIGFIFGYDTRGIEIEPCSGLIQVIKRFFGGKLELVVRNLCKYYVIGTNLSKVMQMMPNLFIFGAVGLLDGFHLR